MKLVGFVRRLLRNVYTVVIVFLLAILVNPISVALADTPVPANPVPAAIAQAGTATTYNWLVTSSVFVKPAAASFVDELVMGQDATRLDQQSVAGPRQLAAKKATQPTTIKRHPVIRTKRYTIHKGDTLSEIARTYHTTWPYLQCVNRLANPNRILAGDTLKVSGTCPRTATTAHAVTTATPRAQHQLNTMVTPASYTTYTVRSGDTLSEIARTYHTSMSRLLCLNPAPIVSDANTLNTGTTLRLTGNCVNRTASSSVATVAYRTTPVTTNPPAGSKASIAVRTALAQLGKPYAWAAAGPDAFDCSGLVLYAWKQAGVYLPHQSQQQYNFGYHVSQADLRPGDLVFFEGGGHVGIYIGNNELIHAPTFGDVVKISQLSGWFVDNYTGAIRLS